MRFTIQTRNYLPGFIPSIVLNQDNPNLNMCTVTLTYQGARATRNIVYSPEDRTAPLPMPPMTAQDISSTYYYVFNYSHFVEMVNAALKTAFNDLRTLVTPAVFDVIPTVAPYLDLSLIHI